MLAAMVNLTLIYAFYFRSPSHIKYGTFTTLRRFTYLYGNKAMYVAHGGVVVETEVVLATIVVTMIF